MAKGLITFDQYVQEKGFDNKTVNRFWKYCNQDIRNKETGDVEWWGRDVANHNDMRGYSEEFDNLFEEFKNINSSRRIKSSPNFKEFTADDIFDSFQVEELTHTVFMDREECKNARCGMDEFSTCMYDVLPTYLGVYTADDVREVCRKAKNPQAKAFLEAFETALENAKFTDKFYNSVTVHKKGIQSSQTPQAELEGYNCGHKSGGDLNDNPYDKDTQNEQWDAWRRGYSEGDEDRIHSSRQIMSSGMYDYYASKYPSAYDKIDRWLYDVHGGEKVTKSQFRDYLKTELHFNDGVIDDFCEMYEDTNIFSSRQITSANSQEEFEDLIIDIEDKLGVNVEHSNIFNLNSELSDDVEMEIDDLCRRHNCKFVPINGDRRRYRLVSSSKENNMIKSTLDTWVDPRSKVNGWKVKVLDVYPDDYAGSTTAKVELFDPEGNSQGEENIYIHRQDVKIGETYDARIDGIMAMPRIIGVPNISYDEVPSMKNVTREQYLKSALDTVKVTFDNGDTIVTDYNADVGREEIAKYYMHNYFNVGGEDEMHQVVKVEFPGNINSARTPEVADMQDAEDLALFAENDHELYDTIIKPTFDSLQRKLKRGIYDKNKALIAWEHVIDEAAKAYDRQLGSKRGTMTMFNKATRKEAAKILMDSIWDEDEWQA